MKIALLSNINCDPVAKKIRKTITCVTPTGYGNVLEALLLPDSEINASDVQVVFLLIDTATFFYGTQREGLLAKAQTFFDMVKTALKPGKKYFISNSDFAVSISVDYSGNGFEKEAGNAWDHALELFCKETGCIVFPYTEIVREIGAAKFYSPAAWYLGSVRYSIEGINAIIGEVLRACEAIEGNVKKLIVVDLDNTLWGGIVGEDGETGILLSESGVGAAYRDFQLILRRLRQAGVLLAIASKNNEEDALPTLRHHPHMILKENDFVALKINWNIKSQSILEITRELNIGLGSVVFIDDNPIERKEVETSLEGVCVPDFPDSPYSLAFFGAFIAHKYFKRIILTDEDREKMEQYAARAQIERIKECTTDFNDFLKGLEIRVERVDPVQNTARVIQLIQKTNQFNTSVIRYTQEEVENIIADAEYSVYLFNVSDCFANHGICALAIVNQKQDTPIIESFIMSCRVMGRNIEFGILDYIESELSAQGGTKISAQYIEGPRNQPVEGLYLQAGYSQLKEENGRKTFEKIDKTAQNNKFVGFIG